MQPSFLQVKQKDFAANACEFIPNKLYFTSVAQQLAVDMFPDTHFFTIDHILVYINFYADFGPNNIAHVFRFCEILGQKLLTHDKSICLVTSADADKRANGAYLICFYMMLVYKLTPEEACAPIAHIAHTLIPYRDAGYGAATYFLSVLDCLRGFYKALQLGLFHVDSFDVEEYEFYERVENGDFNWITDKFIAIASPKDEGSGLNGFGLASYATTSFLQSRMKKSDNSRLFSVTKIDGLIRYCKEHNITTVVRLNNKLYDRNKFIEAGIEHVEMYFPDGTTPPDNILLEFMELCERTPVHCKAGLGRTGSLIAAYYMKHFKMTASEIISFLRVMRPGSVVGPQQNWLESMQETLWVMHPEKKLSSKFSLLKPSTLASYSRFSAFAQACPIYTSASIPQSIDFEMEVDQPRQKSRGSSERKSKQASEGSVKNFFRVVKNNNSVPRSFVASASVEMKETFSIPIQPRKGMDTSNGAVMDMEEPIGEDFSADHRYSDYTQSISTMRKWNLTEKTKATSTNVNVTFNKQSMS